MSEQTRPVDLGAVESIRRRWASTTRGPWRWWGNTESGTEAIVGRVPGLGITEVLSTLDVERTADDAGARSYRGYLRECADYPDLDATLSDLADLGLTDVTQEDLWSMDRTDPEDPIVKRIVDARIEQQVREDYLTDQWGEPISDRKLALTDPETVHRHPVSSLAVYEVARSQGLPDETGRDHPKVYRHDIVDVRNGNGRALAASWQDVHDLLAVVQAQQELLGRVRVAVNEGDHADTCGAVLSPDRDDPCSCWKSDLGEVLGPEPHPCGHPTRQAGCGGCDPGAGWTLVDGVVQIADGQAQQ